MRARSPRIVALIVLPLIATVTALAGDRGPRFARSPGHQSPVLASAVVAAGTWAYTYGGSGDEDAWVVKHNTDGTWMLGGMTGSVGNGDLWLAKLDTSGGILWQKTYGTPQPDIGDVFAAWDGGYLLTGSTDMGGGVSTTWLCKLNAEGVISWQKQYDGADSNYGEIYSMSDGTFVAVGTEFNFQAMQFSFLIGKLDASGNVVWVKRLSSSKNRFGSVFEQSDGTLLVAGTQLDMASGSTDIWVLKLNATNGALVWEKVYATAGNETGAQAIRLADGGYLLTGAFMTPSGESQTSDVLVMRLSSSGAITWQRRYGGPGNDLGFVQAAVNGGWIFSGTTDSFGAGGEDAAVVKLDDDGNIQWQKTYGGSQRDAGAVFPDSTGGYFLVGDTESFGNGKDDRWIMRLDAQGSITWQRTYGGANEESGVPWRLPDGSVVVTGTTDSYGSGKDDSFVMKLDANGAVSGPCPFIKTTAASPQAGSAVMTVTNLVASAGGSTFADDSVEVTTATVTSAAGTLLRKDLCSATPVLTAQAAANPMSGVAPLAVSFTGSASNGTPPYTFDWSFGDGSAHSSEQSPSHTYASAGTYPVTLTVHDSAGGTAADAHLSIAVSGGGGCVVSCTATVPTTGTVGVPVSFAATVNATGCALAPTAMWNFGDGAVSTQLTTTHTYTEADTVNWTFIASSASGGTPCVKSGEIRISSGGQPLVYIIPSVAHAPGSGGTQWRTNIAVVNRNAAPVGLTLTYYPYVETSPTIVRNHTLGAGHTIEWQDVLVNLFNLQASASNKGSVHISSPLPVFATSRTYNQAANGTYGQYYPALRTADAIPAGQTGTIVQLKKTSVFRTNVGVQNLGTAPCSVTVTLRGPTGTQVGSPKTQTVAAGRYWQQDDIFTNVGAGSRDIAYARVQPTTAGCTAWAYGSVVDGNTGDPTTFPVLFGSELAVHTIAAVAHAPGSGGTQWRTNTAVVNGGAAATTLGLSFLDYTTGVLPVARTHPLAAGATVEWQDILVSLFGKGASASSKGAVQITSTQPLYVTSRTYNQAAIGTYGQYYPSVRPLQGLTTGQVGVIPQLKKTTAFRTNLGIMNVGTADVTVAIKLWSATGSQAGTTKTQTVAAGRYWQQDDVFTNLGAGTRDIAYATIEVQTSGGRIWAYGSVVDNVTGDPTTIPVLF